MSALSLKNLKDNPERLATLIDKVKKRSPFTRVKGEIENNRDNVYLRFLHPSIERILLKGPHTEISGRGNNQIFVETTASGKDKSPQKTFALSDVEKTTELGSSKGSGGGADATASTETMQCYYAAYLLNNSDLNLLDPNNSYAEELTQFFASRPELVEGYDKKKQLSFQDCWDFWVVKLKEDAEWMDTFIATANKIKINATNFTKRPVYFHRGSPFMDSIYARKKKCEKHNKDLIKSGTPPSELKESIASFSDDKWNPGDIWMSTINPNAGPYQPFSWQPPVVSEDMQQHVCDWPSLQTAVYQSAMSGETLGISLKKSGKDASFRAFNSKDPEARKDKITYSGYRFGSGDFFNSADMYIEFNNGSMQYRATASTSSWQGEIKGTKASGGKCGGGPTNYYCELYFDRSIDSDSKLASGTWLSLIHI